MNKKGLTDKARACMNEKNLIEAEVLAKRVLQIDRNSPEAIKILCRIAIDCGAPEKAVSLFENYYSLSQLDTDFALLFCDLYRTNGEYEKERELLSGILKKSEDNRELKKRLVYNSYLQADFDHFLQHEFNTDCGVQNFNSDFLYFHVVNVVYGEEFTQLFVNDVLPTQLGQNNIEALNRDRKSSYIIYTTPQDAQVIIKSEVFKKMSELMNIRIYCVDPAFISRENRHEMMVLSHRHALSKSNAENAKTIFLAPDAVFSSVMFSNIYKRAKEGYRAIMIGTMRVSKEEFLPRMRKTLTNTNTIETPIKARDLVNLALKHFHLDTRNAMIGSESFNGWPSQILWEIPGEGVLAHNYHLHPIMICPEKLAYFNGTIDDDCIATLCDSIEEVYITRDSDEMTGFDFCPESMRALQHKEPLCPEYIAAWADDHADQFHNEFVKHELRIHNGKQSEKWLETGKKADQLLKQIADCQSSEKEHFFPRILIDHDLRYPPMNLEHVHFQPTPEAGETFKKVKELIIAGHVKEFTLGINSEPLLMNQWANLFQKALNSIEKTNLVSGMDMELRENELKILSQFDNIIIDLDMCSISNNQLDTIILNTQNISKNGITPGKAPAYYWKCDLRISRVHELGAIVKAASESGAQQLTLNEPLLSQKMSDCHSSIFSLNGSNFNEHLAIILKAVKDAKDSGLKIIMPHNWNESIERKIKADQAMQDYGVTIEICSPPLVSGGTINTLSGPRRIYRSEKRGPIPGETRECIRPWRSAYITAEGMVHSCPYRTEAMADLKKHKSLREALHTAKYTNLRRQLITGNVIDNECLNCPAKQTVPHRQMKKVVADMIRSSMGAAKN